MFGSSSGYNNHNSQTAAVLRLLAGTAPAAATGSGTAAAASGIPSVDDATLVQLLNLPSGTQAILSNFLLEQEHLNQQQQQQHSLREHLAQLVSPPPAASTRVFFQPSSQATLHDLLALTSQNAAAPLVLQQQQLNPTEWERVVEEATREQQRAAVMRQLLDGSSAGLVTPATSASLDMLSQRSKASHDDKMNYGGTTESNPIVLDSTASLLPSDSNNKNTKPSAKQKKKSPPKPKTGKDSSIAHPVKKKRRTSKASAAQAVGDDADSSSRQLEGNATTLTPSAAKASKKSSGEVAACKKPSQRKRVKRTKNKNGGTNKVQSAQDGEHNEHSDHEDSSSENGLEKYRQSISGIAGGQSIMDIVLGRFSSPGEKRPCPKNDDDENAEKEKENACDHEVQEEVAGIATKDTSMENCDNKIAKDHSSAGAKEIVFRRGCWHPCDGTACNESINI